MKEQAKGFLGGFLQLYNIILGGVVSLLATIFGQYWYLFAAFLVFNLLDYLTGSYKAHELKQESSKQGLKGIIKKLLYWVLVVTAFIIAGVLHNLFLDMLKVDMQWLMMLGWFTLTTLTVNEARSIIENLVAVGIKVPNFLVQGLAITQKLLAEKAAAGILKNEEKTE